jgi:hypothetical protein
VSAERPHLVRGRLAGVSVAGAMRAGALVGFAHGLVLGAILGAVLAWFAGALAGWERELTTTYGIGANLLPFGDQGGALESVGRLWFLVVAGMSLAGGLVGALLGALLAGLLAAVYNRVRPEAAIVVEFTPRETMPPDLAPVPPGPPAHPGRARPRARGSAPPAALDQPTPSRDPRGTR